MVSPERRLDGKMSELWWDRKADPSYSCWRVSAAIDGGAMHRLRNHWEVPFLQSTREALTDIRAP